MTAGSFSGDLTGTGDLWAVRNVRSSTFPVPLTLRVSPLGGPSSVHPISTGVVHSTKTGPRPCFKGFQHQHAVSWMISIPRSSHRSRTFRIECAKRTYVIKARQEVSSVVLQWLARIRWQSPRNQNLPFELAYSEKPRRQARFAINHCYFHKIPNHLEFHLEVQPAPEFLTV